MVGPPLKQFQGILGGTPRFVGDDADLLRLRPDN